MNAEHMQDESDFYNMVDSSRGSCGRQNSQKEEREYNSLVT